MSAIVALAENGWRDRPYRLTQLAVAKLTRIKTTKPSWTPRLIPPWDILAYAAALFSISLCALAARGMVTLPSRSHFLALLSVSLFSGGIAFTRFIETVRRLT